MQKRSLASLVLPLGMAACVDAPTAPAAPEADAVAVAAMQPGDAAPSASVSAALSDGRLLDLNAALSDARLRLVPAVSEDGEAAASPLQAALQRLEEQLAAGDAAGVLGAVADAEAALDALPAGEDGATDPELDAVRLMLNEVRGSTEELAVQLEP
jgi:hypothetical protein